MESHRSAGSGDEALIGRAGHLARLGQVLAQARSGRLAVAWIEGEAGIGKSRLLEAAGDLARLDGCRVLAGTARELEATRPFGPLLDAFGPASDATASAASAGTVDREYQIIEHFLTLLDEATGHAPVLLVLDDLQWADPSTVHTLHAIGRRMTHSPLAVVAAFRPLPRPAHLDALLRATDAALKVSLTPLDQASVSALAKRILSADPGTSVREQLAEAGGNPLFVIELLHALRDEGAIEVEGGVAEAHAAPRPPTLRLTILRRISFLNAETLEMMRVAATLGSAFSLPELSAMTGRTASQLASPLREAVRAGVLIDEGLALQFRHDLIREAIYEDLAPSLRAGLHLDAARALESLGAPALRVAEHIARGATPGDRRAVQQLREKAEACVVAAPAAAVRLLERALELLAPSDPMRNEIAASLVMPLYLTGRITEADTLARDVLAGPPDATTEYLVRRSLAYSLVIRGHASEAVSAYRRLVETSERGEAAETNRAVDFVNLSVALLNAGNSDEAQRVAQTARQIGEADGSDFATALALLSCANIADARGRVDDAIDAARRAMAIVADHPETANYWAHWALGLALVGADQLDEAERVVRAGLRLVEDEGRISQVPLYQLVLQLILMHAGRWDDSLASFESASAVPERARSAVATMYGRGFGAYVAFHQGRLDLASELVDGARAGLAETGLASGGQLFVAMCDALLLDAKGGGGEAQKLLAAAWDAAAATRWSAFAEWRTVAPVLVALSVASNDLATARAVTEAADGAARRAAGATTAAAAALRCRGLLDSDPLVLLEAVELLRSGCRPMDLAFAAEDAGGALGTAGRIDDARVLLEEALAVYEEVGAARSVARIMQRLRGFGIRRGSRKPRNRPASGWESLTPTEVSVVNLVAKGLANAEVARQLYISRYTVETHLKHVYAKLAITSRTELASKAARRESRPLRRPT